MSIETLQQQLSAASDPQIKQWSESYMKHTLPFRGLKQPLVRSIVLAWVKAENFADQPLAAQMDTAFTLIKEPWSEDKLAGALLIQEVLIKNNLIDWTTDLPKFATLFDDGYIAGWSTCDCFCTRVLNPLIKKHGQPCALDVMAWCHAPNLWRKRAAVVSFVNIAKKGEQNFANFNTKLLATCETVVQSPERFAQTGVGWVLRDLGLADQATVVNFIYAHSTKFSSEGLRYAIEKFPPDLQSSLKFFRQQQLKALQG
jgi:3-methyladenine DNA glycosylase AlkD